MQGSPITVGDTVIGVICHESMEEVIRKPDGVARWCFHCRKVRDFLYVVTRPTDRMSYYGPNPSVRCASCNTDDGDCFPGRYRIWEEDW
jgi:hypothetical protein